MSDHFEKIKDVKEGKKFCSLPLCIIQNLTMAVGYIRLNISLDLTNRHRPIRENSLARFWTFFNGCVPFPFSLNTNLIK